jgi:hypothetical protein
VIDVDLRGAEGCRWLLAGRLAAWPPGRMNWGVWATGALASFDSSAMYDFPVQCSANGTW